MAHYILCLNTTLSEISFVVAVLTLTVCIWWMRYGCLEGFSEAPMTNISSVIPGLSQLLLIPKETLQVMKPQLDKVVKSVDPNPAEDEALPQGDYITMDATYVKQNIQKNASDKEAEASSTQFNNINFILSLVKELHPAAYKALMQ